VNVATTQTVREANVGRGRREAGLLPENVKEIVLGAAGLLGLLCLLTVVLSLAFGLSIIVFATGSMAPSMPAGALAVTRPIDAADIEPGDVVTVKVAGQNLPVTHRVVSVSKVSDVPDARSLVLKGDDNHYPDATPYVVKTAKKVLLSAPGLGTALVIARTPLFIGAATLLVAFLVLWAFWPSSTKPEPEIEETP
jgi:signal peptidase